jgi:hypothetical protein
MNTNQKSKLLIDVVLLATFIAAFFLDLTGLALHQWIGLAAGVIAVFHLLTHWNWVKAVSKRLFKNTSGKARLYYVVDAALLLSGLVMLGTGLVISTWFNLSLADYDLWRVVHITSSIAMLGITVLKVGLHSRWIQEAMQNAFARPATLQPKPTTLRPADAKLVSRRAFLGTMGAVGIASAFAMSNALKGLQLSQGNEVTLAPQADTLSPTDVIVEYTTQSVAASQPAVTSTPTAPTATAGQPTATSTLPTATATASQVTASTCSAQCPRGCSYPGHCRKYTDANSNNRCDLGECV